MKVKEVILLNKMEEILQLAEESNGIITTAEIEQLHLAKPYLKNLVELGKLEKSAHGVYVLPEVFEDEFAVLQLRFKKGIYAKETALFLHDLTDRTPIAFSMIFPPEYNLSNAKEAGIIASRAMKKYYELGIVEMASPSGNLINVYNAEKTLCDMVRSKNSETEVVVEAFKRYLNKKNRNIPLLSEYAKILKVERKVRKYLKKKK